MTRRRLEPIARRVAAAAALTAVVAGCATAYRAENLGGGYGETRLEANVFRVTFKGNVRMTQAETNEMALLRSAEVTLANGYAYFLTSGAAPTGSAVSLLTNTVPVPATTMMITCFEAKPETGAVVYDARLIVETVGPKYLKPSL